MPAQKNRRRWDIFCVRVDNYGDIGVCWRLARQLVAEHGIPVRLWVDDLKSFARIAPQCDPEKPRQAVSGVEVCHWTPEAFAAPLPEETLPDTTAVVIEGFACELPENYVAAMAMRSPPPRWINLEYLSAESWVAECHGLPSPHPRLPLTKHFFIPGFDEKSAGLLREQALSERLAAFEVERWWQVHGGQPGTDTLSISLFAYENPAMAALLDDWQRGAASATHRQIRCLVTDSLILNSVCAAMDQPHLLPGETLQAGTLELRVLPFMPQDAYDDLLAACDLNFVRGEDSLVRALWAGKPFVWHIYRQEDEAHLRKLDAFLDRYCVGLAPAAETALRNFWHAWNAGSLPEGAWPSFIFHYPEIARHTLLFRERLLQLPDLTKTLADFCLGHV